MDKYSEVKIWLLDTELELSPISAHELLSAKEESRKLLSEYGPSGGADDFDEKICLDACILARGLYNGEKRFLSSGGEVLQNLTAEEILFAAEEYSYDELAKLAAVTGPVNAADTSPAPAEEAAKRPSEGEPGSTSGGSVMESIPESGDRIIAAPESAEAFMEDYKNSGSKAPERQAVTDEAISEAVSVLSRIKTPSMEAEAPGQGENREIPEASLGGKSPLSEKETLRAALKRRSAEIAAAFHSIPEYENKSGMARIIWEQDAPGVEESVYRSSDRAPFTSGYGTSPARSMRDVSDFFERDSRRYGGNFKLF